MGFIKEFKDFAIKGNLVDIAVGFVMGAAFTRVVTTFTEGMIAPLVGLLTGKDLSANVWTIKDAVTDATGKEIAAAVVVKWGAFITACIDFLIVALVMFLVIKAINGMKKKEEVVVIVPELSATDKLLIEIRDALKK